MDPNNPNEENNIEDEENLAFLPADHHLLAKLQAALTKQLTDEHQRVDLQLTEVEDTLKKLERSKEDIGVRLYGVQQQLAENQVNFEQAHENYNLVQKLRMESEQKLKNINDIYTQKKKEVEELRKKYIKAQDELSKLTRTLHQIVEYNHQMKSELAVTRRTVYRGEENVGQLERQKRKQDFLIDQMNEEIKRLTEQKTILTAQLISQKEETEQARQIMKEAQMEMQKIIASKKNLLERWQKSLVTMQRMDKALQSIKEALKFQQEINIQLGTELNGINNEIKKEAIQSEELNYSNNRLNNEKRYLETKRDELEEELKKLHAQISLLTKSLSTTEAETKKTDIDKKNIEEQMNMIETNIMKLHTETKKLVEELVNSKSEHTTIEKTAMNLFKQAQQIAQDIEEKEMEHENLNNEIARVRIDQLNTQSQIELLENKKKDVIKEREEKEITVATYEVQIRQGHDLNEKKQHEVGRLNKVHDEYMSNSSEINRGPLEAIKNNLKRQLEELTQQCESMHRDWIKKQTLLVKQNNQHMKFSEEVSQLSTKQTILEQKKMRLNGQYRQHEKEIRDIKNSLKNLQNDMNKLNDELSNNLAKKQKLDNENFNVENEFKEKLKELEKESVRLEVEIDKLKEGKSDLLNEIVECEKHILLWERKIQLEREMQEALDPNVGQSELQELKKEIHRMELRLEDLRKKQEQLISEMERAVYKRETIQLKYMNKGKSDTLPAIGKSSNAVSKSTNVNLTNTNQVSKQISTLKNTLNQTSNNAKLLEQGIQQRMEEAEQLAQQIEESNERYQLMEGDTYQFNQNLFAAKVQRYINIFLISQKQHQAKKYDDLLNNAARLTFPEAQLKRKLEEQRQMTQVIKQSLFQIAQEQPQYQQILQPLLDLQ